MKVTPSSLLALALLALVALGLLACGETQAGDDDYVARMEAEHRDDRPVPSPMASEKTPAVASSEVVYARLADEEIRGYLVAPPDEETPTAAIFLIHEWWGLNDNIRAIADRLASEGYLALAGDLYHGQVASDRETAASLARASREETEALADSIGQGLAYLRDEHGIDSIGVIGWCFGGGWSLQTALRFPSSVDAAVIYYGRLVTAREELAGLESPILGIFGALDRGIPIATVEEFESVLSDLGKEATIRVYEEADHAFANPSGTRYREADAEDAWGRTLDFFAEHLIEPAGG